MHDLENRQAAPDAAPAPGTAPSGPDPAAAGPPPEWTHWPVLLPLATLVAAFWVSKWSYGSTFACAGGADGECRSVLLAFRQELSSLHYVGDGGIRAAYDVAARFSWQSTFVLFVVVAGLAAAGAASLAYRSLRESGIGRSWLSGPRFAALAVVVAAGAFAASWLLPDQFLVRTDLLAPFIEKAFAPNPSPVRLVEDMQRVFRAMAFTASTFVALAAAAALLAPPRGGGAPLPVADHLANQWHRLTYALYAGAALLVAAVVYQTAFYGWARSLADAVGAEADQVRREAVAQVAEAGSRVDDARGAHLLAARRVAEAEARARAARGAAERASIAGEIRRERAALAAAAARFRADSLARESVSLAAARDTTRARAAASRAAAAGARMSMITDAAISRAGGLVYSLMLAVLYLPAALVLLERARELSVRAAPTEAKRRKWRAENGMGFSLATQWGKALAVLSPWLASFPAAQFLLKVLE